LSSLRVSPRTFTLAGRRVGRRCLAVTRTNRRHAACRRPIRLQVTYTLNEATTVALTLTRQLPGRTVRRKCVKPTGKNKRNNRCTRPIPIRGSIVKAGQAGWDSFTFNGWIARHRLVPGSYRLTATPTAGKPQTVTFRIVG
jgi:hypothetical protein